MQTFVSLWLPRFPIVLLMAGLIGAGALGFSREEEPAKERRSVQVFLDDTRIQTIALAKLADQKKIQLGYLRVRVREGVVLVDGFVRDLEERELAVRTLQEIKYVRSVVAQCTVVSDLGEKGEHETKFSGPGADLLLGGKIANRIRLAVKRRELPAGITVCRVNVFKGDARVYLIVREAGAEGAVAAISREVGGVNSCAVHTCVEAQP